MDRLKKAGIRAESRAKLLLTAAEAYPALEVAFLEARKSIHASFRIFDLDTKLRSRKARMIGRTWFDLVVHVLKRGVELRVDLCDFDPCGAPELHRKTWSSVRMFAAARELAGPRARLVVRPLLHPAQAGIVPRIGFWPLIWRKLGRHADWLNAMPEAERRAALRDMPGLAPHLRIGAEGKVSRRMGRPACLWPATHHQKLAVFDDRLLYIGGLDLNDRRYDTPEHRRKSEQTWHDVQVMMTGPVVREAKAHLESFHESCQGADMAQPPRRLLRTLSQKRGVAGFHLGPKPYRSEIESAHEMLINRAQQLIYLETQFFRSRRLARHLAKAARSNPRLGLILMLPAAPERLAFSQRISADVRYGEFLQARAIETLADAFGGRLFVGAPAAPRGPKGQGEDRTNGAPLVYIHAKVSIFDDDAALVTSANLNGRSLSWDSEAGVYLRRNDGIEEMRHRVMRHWLPKGAEEAFFDPVRAVSAWSELARANAAKPPEERQGFLMPYDLAAARRVGRRLPFLPEEML